MNSKCNLGRALQGIVGGTLEHEEHMARDRHLGDRFTVRDIEDKLSPERIEADIDIFLVKQGFYLAKKQFEKHVALAGGSLRRYEHGDYPLKIYSVTISAPKSKENVTVDIRIFDNKLEVKLHEARPRGILRQNRTA